MRSKGTRIKRKVIKNIRETRIMNKWAKQRQDVTSKVYMGLQKVLQKNTQLYLQVKTT